MNRYRLAIKVACVSAVSVSSIFSHCDSDIPGTIPKNSLNCDVPACDDTKDHLMKSFSFLNMKEDKGQLPCPLNKAELGASAWDLIHTLAANYPENPTLEEQEAALQFVNAIALLYPCKICAEDFRYNFSQSPPNVKSRKEFALWWCARHNEVNNKLGKETIPCDFAILDRRWRKGDKTCIQRKYGN